MLTKNKAIEQFSDVFTCQQQGSLKNKNKIIQFLICILKGFDVFS